MRVIEFLKSFSDHEKAMAAIQDEPYNVKVDRAGDLVLLNYDMLSARGTIADDCRALLLRLPDFQTVSFSFRRFFNHNEGYAAPIDWQRAVVNEKVDGTLIVFYHNGKAWDFHTRGKIGAVGPTSDGRSAFRERVIATIGDEPDSFLDGVPRNLCVACEYVGPYNRIVTQYPKEDLYLLAVTDRETHRDVKVNESWWRFSTPKQYRFGSLDEVVESMASLPKLDEGYVVFDGLERIKIKSPTYLAMHGLVSAGNSPTDKNFARIALGGDTDEIKGYFPEFIPRIEAMERTIESLSSEAEAHYNANCGAASQKDFAMAVKAHPLSAWMFSKRARKHDLRCREWMRDNVKPEVLCEMQ